MYYAGKKPKKPKPIPPPKPIPVQDVTTTDTADRKAESLRRRQGGVASTALTETLGG